MLAVLRLTGPNFEREVALDPGGSETTLGRDSKQADVKLPDPDLFISRKHVALRSAGDCVELRVVSAVNGAQTSKGPVRPGERVRLDDADYFVLGPYTVTVGFIDALEAPPPRMPAHATVSGMPVASPPDLFAGLFDDPPVAKSAAPPAEPPAPPHGQPFGASKIDAWLNDGLHGDDDAGANFGTKPYPRPPEDDSIGAPEAVEPVTNGPMSISGGDSHSVHVWRAFSEQGARNDVAPESHGEAESRWPSPSPAPPSPWPSPTPVPHHQTPASVDPTLWNAFVKGLGLPSSHLIDERTAEHTGAMIRLLVEGLVELLKARTEIKRQLGVTDRTEIKGHANNAFKLDLSTLERVQYIFSPHVGATYMPAAQAVRESISELQMHEHATLVATRAALEGALKEFEPARLRSQLMPGRPSPIPLLGNARAWKAYEGYYQERSAQFGDWLETTFDRYFTPTYAQESSRLKSLQAPLTDSESS